MSYGAEYGAEQTEDGPGILSNLPAILWERKWVIIVPLVLCTIAAVVAAFTLPRTYRSSALLLVESQELPGDVSAAPADNVIDRRMAKIRQQILSRPDLVDLIQTNDLYNASARTEPLSKLVERMRDATQISAVDADIAQGGAGRGGAASIAFSLSFDYARPDLAQLVAQTFVDRLLKLDASATQSQAQNGVRFLQDQESDLQRQISMIEAQINRITGQNGLALSSGSSLGMITMGGGGYEQQIASLQRENALLSAQTGRGAVERDPGVVAAQSQLSAARALYSDDHPDVKLAESRLAAARSAASELIGSGVSATAQRQIASNNGMIADLNRARGAEQARAAAMSAAQARGPAIVQQVSQLQARADILRANLGRVSTGLMNARSVSKLADEQRGERLALIDPPVTPDAPSSPNRPILIAGGIVAGAGIGLALTLLAEFIMRPIRSVAALAKLTGAPPLAVVPVLSRRRRRRRRWPFGPRVAARS